MKSRTRVLPKKKFSRESSSLQPADINNIASRDWDANSLNLNPNKDLRPDPMANRVVIEEPFSFAAVWNYINKIYPTRYRDTATLSSWADALAMRRDSQIYNLIRARQTPTLAAEFAIVAEDEHDKKQLEIVEEVDAIVRAIPNFQQLKLSLLESKFFGVAAAQTVWDWTTVRRKKVFNVVSHTPVNGDKVVYEWQDGYYGILIYRGFNPPGALILSTDRGPALLLDRDEFRDQFIIMSDEQLDRDYLFESQLAGNAKLGVGLRDKLYFYYVLRRSILDWMLTALQRVSTSGLLIGRYPMGNVPAQEAMVAAMIQLQRDSATTAPRDQKFPEGTDIESIMPSSIGYDILYKMLEYFDGVMRELVLGQNLTSKSASIGLNSGLAEVHENTFQNLINCDAKQLSEVLTEQLIKPIIKYNYGSLPFKISLNILTTTKDLDKRMAAAKTLYDIGCPLDMAELLTLGGFKAPDPDDAHQQLVSKADMMKVEFEHKMNEIKTSGESKVGNKVGDK